MGAAEKSFWLLCTKQAADVMGPPFAFARALYLLRFHTAAGLDTGMPWRSTISLSLAHLVCYCYSYGVVYM